MEFCEKCGGMILIEGGKGKCMSCGYSPKKKLTIEAAEKIKKHDSIAVIEEGKDNTNPVVEIKCPKCKNKKAYFWISQTRSSDESETKFYKCTNCSHTWRVYR